MKTPLDISTTATSRVEVLAGITDPDVRSRLAHAEIILLPRVAEPPTGPAFASNTREVFRFLRANLPNSSSVEVATETDEIALVVLHGELLDLGVILASTVAAPLLVRILGDYISNRLRDSRERRDSAVRCRMLIEKRDGSCSALDYDGPADTFEELMRAGMTKTIGGREHEED